MPILPNNVTSDTYFYAIIASVNDSPPILGTFPTNASQNSFYWYDPSQLGATTSITVDGQQTFLDPSYLAGPVNLSLPNGGSNTIVFATFLAPFQPGTHTVSVQASFNGTLVVDYCRANNLPDTCGVFPAVNYTVTSTTVPEPASLLGTVVFGAAVVTLKRKQKKLSRSNSAPIQ
ncbi:PEP-CTERM sorting domain-containing protein [Chamaesiphon sp. VAR_48_metabat_135_sub]|uniref:PEP-CTERM sorting domain-containing protein n=1 Tax=Chamaesiphon sp. VAR_48_metabat_135_sub TaxID=2964699 RepID=UPI00286D44B2|nr:PEP-CTERM sorting domain-containing protein [Chamaesiphon sp. VAR_48_metabat_135_sub]